MDLAHHFLTPHNTTHRQYEALRAYYVDKLPGPEVARRFGYSLGSFRQLAHQFAQDPGRLFFLEPTRSKGQEPDAVQQQIIQLRKQNLSIYDISDALQKDGIRRSPVAVSQTLTKEGFVDDRSVVQEKLSRTGDTPSAIVDAGCGDGGLLAAIAEHLDDAGLTEGVGLIGIDRGLGFLPDERRSSRRFTFSSSLDAIPPDRPVLVICNELFDAIPFSRVVQREAGLSELCVTLGPDGLDWTERPAGPDLAAYLERRRIALAPGQFADFAPEWGSVCGSIASRISEGMLLILDYGYDAARLFDNRVPRFGTAAAYSGHQVHRDLLERPGEQDLTCHVNFDDLIDSGERAGLKTLAFTRLARFLLEAGAAGYPLFTQSLVPV